MTFVKTTYNFAPKFSSDLYRWFSSTKSDNLPRSVRSFFIPAGIFLLLPNSSYSLIEFMPFSQMRRPLVRQLFALAVLANCALVARSRR